LDQNTDRQVLMSDSKDNSVMHEQEVQALIDELTGTDLQFTLKRIQANLFFNKKIATKNSP
jgi:hypothetical protein